MTTTQDWERRRKRWAEWKAQQEDNRMTRSELLKQYKIVATRRPKKGETIIAVKWVGGDCSVVKVTGDNNRVVADILEKVDSRD